MCHEKMETNFLQYPPYVKHSAGHFIKFYLLFMTILGHKEQMEVPFDPLPERHKSGHSESLAHSDPGDWMGSGHGDKVSYEGVWPTKVTG
jgi:hypothetical protein